MLPLQDVINAWGFWRSAGLGTSPRFIEATNYANRDELNDYHQYQTAVDVKDIAYNGTSLPTNGSKIARTVVYHNDTDVSQSHKFAHVATSTQTFEWSMTETLSVGIEVKATAGVPEVASTEVSISTELTLSANQTWKKEEVQEWREEAEIIAPAKSNVTAVMSISTQSYDINFTAAVILKGFVAIWFEEKVALNLDGSLHYLWFIPIQAVINDCNSYKLADTQGYLVTQGGVSATAKGKFSGSQGISTAITATQSPLHPNDEASPLQQIPLTYSMQALALHA